jgi:GABA(A) receptor-associated protein
MEASKLITRYPDRIPLIIKPGNSQAPKIEKVRYLVPKDMTLSQFMAILRKKVNLTPKQAMFVFIGGVLPPMNKCISELYAEHADPDGFLYLVYSLENTFGAFTTHTQ